MGSRGSRALARSLSAELLWIMGKEEEKMEYPFIHVSIFQAPAMSECLFAEGLLWRVALFCRDIKNPQKIPT